LCVGLEHVEDIINDLKIGLDAASKVSKSQAA
jgi:cystathionine beta-lyase/cystathionine gamma-synthase